MRFEKHLGSDVATIPLDRDNTGVDTPDGTSERAASRSPKARGERFRPSVASCAGVGLLGLLIGTPTGGNAKPQPEPSLLLKPLFQQVAEQGLFDDEKAWADAVPARDPAAILRSYEARSDWTASELRDFIGINFKLDQAPTMRRPAVGLPLAAHVGDLWPLLTRRAKTVPRFSSLLPLPNPYVVPGGRFTEIYYWDSYFTMLGFGARQAVLKRQMVDNFAYLIRTYGHVPNGSRTYYLTRSQPPFFFKMVALTDSRRPARAYANYLPTLIAEYRFWMRGSDRATVGKPIANSVRMSDGSVLNRYWDDSDTPRDESYEADVRTARASDRSPAIVYRDIRAGAKAAGTLGRAGLCFGLQY